MNIETVLAETVDAIQSLKAPHPLRIGIDGASASGKSTFANQLVEPLRKLGRTVIRASIDGFHNSPEIRYRQGQDSPIGYVEDSFDKSAVIENVLKPLGPDGDLSYCESLFDFVSNQRTQAKPQQAPADSILIFEGVMLFCDQLAHHFDFRIFVDSNFDTIINRALKRDSDRLGGKTATLEKYNSRYIPGQKEYFERHSPQKQANLVIDNNDYRKPRITVRRPIKEP
ncbi:MAG: uridine kinase [Candidatus Pelagisphaera sp.]|jgi:uridine kinase